MTEPVLHTVLITTNAHPDIPSEGPTAGERGQDPRFSVLKGRFARGGLPNFETDIKGWHTGQCYSEEGPAKDQTPVLIAGTRKIGGNDVAKGFVVWWQNVGSGYFDQMTKAKANILSAKEDEFFSTDRFLPLRAMGSGLLSYVMLDDGFRIQNEFRLDGGTIIARYQDDLSGDFYCAF